MKAIIWKEFRENAKWAAPGFAGMLIFTVGLLYDGYHYDGPHASEWESQSSMGDIFRLTLFGSFAIPVALGLLQTILEIRRDQWAFLMHRGVSATQIFIGKAIAGLSLYFIAMFVPLLIAAVCYSRWSPKHLVFDWRYVVVILVSILAGCGVYFAAMIVAMRQSWIYVTNLLPLVLPILALFAVPFFVFNINESIPIWVVLAIAASIIPTALGAWGTFLRSGQSAHLPKAARIGLGVNLTVSFVAGLACVVLTVGWLVEDHLQLRPSINSRYYSYAFTRGGHILRTTYDTLHDGGSRDRLPEMAEVDYTDLDDPDSQILDEVREWQMAVKQDPSARNRDILNLLPMSTVYYQSDGFGARFRPFGGARRLVEQLSPFDALSWHYSVSDGHVYGYDHRRQPQIAGPPELKWVVGPNGFAAAGENPGAGFGKPISISPPKSGRPRFVFWAREERDGEVSRRQFLLFEEAIYEMDFAAKNVRQVYLPPEGKRIRNVAQLGNDRVAVIFEDAIYVHQAKSVIERRAEDRFQGSRDLLVSLPGDLLFSIPIPEAVKPFDQFDFAGLPGDDVFVFACQFDSFVSDKLLTRLVTMKKNGEVLKVLDLPNWPANGLIRNSTPAACAAAACVPPIAVAVAAAFDALIQTVNGTGPGLFVRIVRFDPLAVVPAVLVMLLLSACSVAVARHTARQYGFAASERRRWLLVSLLVGPAGLMALFCLRPWSVRLPCPMCGEPCPVDLEFCQRCRSAVEPVHLDGTEILQDAAAMAF